MNLPAVEFRGVSKTFHYVQNRPRSLKSMFVSIAKGDYFKLPKTHKTVLQDVSFTIGRGEVVGIMGRNGTGKSTLLRILCGIYQPDQGEVIVHDRIAPLVALGAGFHNDLSGYENILLNGAILGIPRSHLLEITPQIIEFSELGHEIYNPIKNYSSGMIVRLGFSVACHLDAPIVVLDEVLSVGDEGFQRKCMMKIEEFFANGKTVILVTHDPHTIRKFCRRCLVLDQGRLIFDGDPLGGAQSYHELFGTPDA
jgi:ABC-type polysaccharide/polyol phosphate transport system ATPase subunit